MGLGHLWAVLETLRDFRDPISATAMLKGLAAPARAYPVPHCSPGRPGSIISPEQIMPSLPSVPRALAWAPWRNYDTSRLTPALRNTRQSRAAAGE